MITAALATWMARASLLLFGGSAFLLFGAIGFDRTQGYGWFVLLLAASMGALLHGLAWWVLARISEGDASRRVLNAVGGATAAVLFGGIAMAAATPASWGFLFLVFPYAPWVFGPVVLVHGRLFDAMSRDLPAGREAQLIGTGSLVLRGLALLGIASQAWYAGVGGPAAAVGDGAGWRLMIWSFFPYPAGLTAVGYALAWWGWSGVALDRRRAESPRASPQGAP